MTQSSMEAHMNFTNVRSSHKYIIGVIQQKISEKDKGGIIKFKEAIKGLQQLREKSDYKNEKIIIDDSSKAIEASQKLKEYLKTTLA